MDLEFIEFYIYKKYKITTDKYFEVSRPVLSIWRNDRFPKGRLSEFIEKEGSDNVFVLFDKLYKREG